MKSLFKHGVTFTKIATFRSDYEYEFEYDYNFQISKHLRFQSPRFFMLLIGREWGSRNEIGVIGDNLSLRPGIEKP